jgi:hypothetical protein
MFLRSPDGRAVRMLIALLAAADPLGKVDAGSAPDAYAPLATRLLAILQQGGSTAHVITAIEMHAPGRRLDVAAERAAYAVADAVADWWVNARDAFELAAAS